MCFTYILISLSTRSSLSSFTIPWILFSSTSRVHLLYICLASWPTQLPFQTIYPTHNKSLCSCFSPMWTFFHFFWLLLTCIYSYFVSLEYLLFFSIHIQTIKTKFAPTNWSLSSPTVLFCSSIFDTTIFRLNVWTAYCFLQATDRQLWFRNVRFLPKSTER